MKLLFEIVVLGALAWQIDALRCRRCIGASNLDECTFSVPCTQGEVCYMDEVITEQLTIEYNGGCRPRDNCLRSAPIGKRAGSLTACSKCCDTDNGKGPECNTKLCGLRPTTSNNFQCYHCRDDTPGGGTAVDDADKCTRLTSCQGDEFCGADTFLLSSKPSYAFSCTPKTICSILTREALTRIKECKDDPSVCGLRRETPGTKVCSACCGDALCNSGTCQDTLDRLYNLWTGGVLDFDTLKTNATAAAKTTTTAATNPQPASGTVTQSGR